MFTIEGQEGGSGSLSSVYYEKDVFATFLEARLRRGSERGNHLPLAGILKYGERPPPLKREPENSMYH